MRNALSIVAVLVVVVVCTSFAIAPGDRDGPEPPEDLDPPRSLADQEIRIALAEVAAANHALANDRLDETVALAEAEAIRAWNDYQLFLWAEAVRQAEEAERARLAEVERQRQADAARQRQERPIATPGTGRCGGDLPPCYVMMRESGGNITAQNPRSTASGKWQFLRSTWGGYGGYLNAKDAPESVQDERARQLWDNGRGCSHWSACT